MIWIFLLGLKRPCWVDSSGNIDEWGTRYGAGEDDKKAGSSTLQRRNERGQQTLMFLCIAGFFPDGHENEYVQFELDVAPGFNQAVLDLVGWSSLEEGVKHGVVALTATQVRQIESVLGQPIPSDLDICISVFA
ncbi:pyocin S6 family toxin immunity protein [Pseudomonas chlororaphis]